MITASCRAENAFGSVVFSRRLHWSGDDLSTLKGRRVLVVCHGSANSGSELVRLANEIANRTHASYDAWVLFAWPGGSTGVAYLGTKFLSVRRAAKFLAEAIDEIGAEGPLTIDVDAHSLGVPIALEAYLQTDSVVDGLWLKAGACSRDLSKYADEAREWGTSVNVFYSPRDLIVSVLYRVWFGFSGALGAYGEKSKGGNIGVQWDVTSEIKGSHVDYRRCSVVTQAMFEEAKRRLG